MPTFSQLPGPLSTPFTPGIFASQTAPAAADQREACRPDYGILFTIAERIANEHMPLVYHVKAERIGASLQASAAVADNGMALLRDAANMLVTK